MSPDFILDIVFGAATGVTADIVSGAVAGVTAGVVLKVLDWLANRYWFRRGQIRYLRNLLAKERDNIYACRTIPHPNPEQPDIPANQSPLGNLSSYEIGSHLPATGAAYLHDLRAETLY